MRKLDIFKVLETFLPTRFVAYYFVSRDNPVIKLLNYCYTTENVF